MRVTGVVTDVGRAATARVTARSIRETNAGLGSIAAAATAA
jgi:hypothetical protein